MPSKNTLKIYIKNGYYHLYNRGVEKRKIFQDEQDYAVFLSYLKIYLLPKDENNLKKLLLNSDLDYRERDNTLRLLNLNNFADEITLLAYCLMPNHFHLLLKQKSENSIDVFMRSLCTRYTMFFNKKNKRVGPLYQSVYKAVAVESQDQLLYLTSYIHRNPVTKKHDYFSQPSSLPEFFNQRKTSWIHPEEILPYFSKTNPNLSYQNFVKQSDQSPLINKLLIDN